MTRRLAIVTLASVLAFAAGIVCPVYAGDSEGGDKPGVVDRIGETVKKIGKKIGEGFEKTVKKIEKKNVPEKVERKLKKAVDKTAEGFDKAERKIKKKLAD